MTWRTFNRSNLHSRVSCSAHAPCDYFTVKGEMAGSGSSIRGESPYRRAGPVTRPAHTDKAATAAAAAPSANAIA